MRKLLLSTCLLLSINNAAHATDYLNVYTGYFDITQDDNAAAQFGLEYRAEDVYYGLRPAVGVNFSSDSAAYGYGGFFWDIPLTERWIFTPNFVAGAFTHGHGKDLGHGIEFRSGLELSYQFETKNRISVAFNHISNASLGTHNPGAETLLIGYQFPLELFGEPVHSSSQWQRPDGY